MTSAMPYLIACAVLTRALAAMPAYGADPVVQGERAVKAAFIYNFAKFTDWPAAAGGTPDALVLCAFSDESYAPALAAIEGKPVQGRAMRVRRDVRLGDIKSCHMMFIAESAARRSPELLRAARAAPVLTIGEAEGFAEPGGMIGLIAEDNRVQFEINTEAVQRARLKISAQLLRLARIVKER
jgi:hypothetical protein